MATLLPTLRESFGASDATAGDKYGWGVASNSDGSIIAVGAPNRSDSFYQSGSVYIREWNGSAYIETHIIEPDIPLQSIWFGYSVSLNDAGDVLAVGAPSSGASGTGDGEVYIFYKSGATWLQRDIIPSTTTIGERSFGSGVSLSGNGTRIVIGSDGWAIDDISNEGAVFTFEYSASVWSESTDRIESALGNKYFGQGVSISSDGDVLAVGEGDSSVPKYGSVHIYDRVGGAWILRYIVYNSVQVNDDGFGWDVALSFDGTVLFASAYKATLTQTSQGKVYKFSLGLSSYVERGEFIRDGAVVAADYFGSSVDTTDLGEVVLVGMYGTSSSTGTVQAFTLITGSSSGTQLSLDVTAVGEHDMVVSYASNPVVLINATAEGHAQNVGAGSALLLGIASASGYYPINGDGSALLAISATGKGQLRNAATRHLNQESELSIGFIESVRHLNQESELNAFLQKQRQLDQENKISIYQSGQRQLNQENELNAYEPKYRILNQENSLFIARQYVRQLNQEMALSAYEQAQRKFNQESKLSAYESRQRHLNQENALPILVEVVRYLNQEGELNAYEPRVRQLNQESSTSIYKTVIRYLNGEYSLKVALQKIRQLNQSSELDAYQQATRQLNQESTLLAYLPVIRFLDICYELQADEKFFTFATNLETGATSEYTKYEFNSLSDGIGASSSGIYDLASSAGDGSDIEVLLELGKSDFGKIAFKRLTDSYLGVSSDGNLKLTVTTESGTESYTLSPSTSLETVKSNLARGHKGRWWSIKVENVDGSSIELESIEVLIQLLSRRR